MRYKHVHLNAFDVNLQASLPRNSPLEANVYLNPFDYKYVFEDECLIPDFIQMKFLMTFLFCVSE